MEIRMKSKIKYPIGGYAPGNYLNTCRNCKESFMGDKRAIQCEPCAINQLIESHSELARKVRVYEKAFNQIRELYKDPY